MWDEVIGHEENKNFAAAPERGQHPHRLIILRRGRDWQKISGPAFCPFLLWFTTAGHRSLRRQMRKPAGS